MRHRNLTNTKPIPYKKNNTFFLLFSTILVNSQPTYIMPQTPACQPCVLLFQCSSWSLHLLHAHNLSPQVPDPLLPKPNIRFGDKLVIQRIQIEFYLFVILLSKLLLHFNKYALSQLIAPKSTVM